MEELQSAEKLIRVPVRIVQAWLDQRAGGRLADGSRGGISEDGTLALVGFDQVSIRCLIAGLARLDDNSLSIFSDHCPKMSGSALSRRVGGNASRIISSLKGGPSIVDSRRECRVMVPAFEASGSLWGPSPEIVGMVGGSGSSMFMQVPESILGLRGAEFDVGLRFGLLFRLRFTNMARRGGIENEPRAILGSIGAKAGPELVQVLSGMGIVSIEENKIRIPAGVFNAYARGLWKKRKRRFKK